MKPTPDTPGVDDPGRGRRLGIDVGTVRIGVAVSDRDAVLATPVETVARESGFSGPDQADIDRLLELIDAYDVVEVVVGLPRKLNGTNSISVKHAKDVAFRIKRRLLRADRAVPVRFADERLTTVVASASLAASGVSTRDRREIIDQAAAVEILQSWLDGRAHHRSRHEVASTSDEELT